MRLTKLQVSQFRGLAEQEISLGDGLNLLAGENGQGKSSLLEAIYLLGTTRSFRTSRLSEVIRVEGGPARVAGIGEEPGHSLAILLSRSDRQYLRNGKAASPAEYIGTLDVVALSSDIVQGFRRKPAERRRFLDRMALATWPGYLAELGDLRRACLQRSLLAAAGVSGRERIAWDERAATLSLPVVSKRLAMAEALGHHLREASRRIFPEGEGAVVRLVSRPPFAPDREKEYVDMLREIFSAQEPSGGRRETPAGPLRDDLAVLIEGRDLLRFGSSGQFRSLLTAAVLAEMNRLKGVKGVYPVMLLDDVDADLDEGRYAALLSGLEGEAQIFAATSKPGLAIGAARPARRFTVARGAVNPS